MGSRSLRKQNFLSISFRTKTHAAACEKLEIKKYLLGVPKGTSNVGVQVNYSDSHALRSHVSSQIHIYFLHFRLSVHLSQPLPP